MQHGMRYGIAAGSLLALLATSIPGVGADALPPKSVKANYELAARWTPAKVGKIIFDTAVTPHWMDSGDRFWYSFENSAGRRFYIVDPAKKTKSMVFDPAKLAASLTTATGLPYDSQHLPITVIRFVKNEASIQFEVNVPRDAAIPGEKKPTGTAATTDGAANQQQDDAANEPQQQLGGRGGSNFAPPPARNQKQLAFEYELASGKLALLDDAPKRKPAWASISPDDKTVVFARNHNLFMMDAENYAKALKSADDKSIQETQLSTDGVEDFGYGGRGAGGDQQQQQQEQQRQQEENQQGQAGQGQDNTRARVSAGNIAWSRDSKKFALVRRDSRKIPKLWVINALANPRPALETYSYAMPGEANTPQAQLEIFDVASKAKVLAKVDAFKDQTMQIEVDRPAGRQREHEKTEALWTGPGSDKLYFNRLSRDMKRLDVCVADTTTGEVKPLIQERMNVYIESKPLKVINNGAELVFWSERDGWGHYYLYGADGTLEEPDHPRRVRRRRYLLHRRKVP